MHLRVAGCVVPGALEGASQGPRQLHPIALRPQYKWLNFELKRAFESKRDFFVQFLMRFGIFYLCNGCSIKRFL